MANPKLRFKEFIEPWETKPLNNVFSLFSGFAFPSSASCDSGVRWLKISDVGIQTMVCSNPSYLPYELKEKYPEFIVNKDEYVIALTRPILNKQLKLAKVGEIYDGALLNQRVAKLISKSSNVDFVYSLLQKSDVIELLANSIAGSDPPNLSLSEIKNINLTIPRIEEQTKIANFLTVVDEKISQLNEQHQLMIQYKKGVMQKIFSQDIRFKDDNGEDFEKWKICTLSQLAYSYTGLSGKNKDDFGRGFAYITYKQIFDNRKIDLSKVEFVEISNDEKQNKVKKNDLFFTTSSETPDEVAFCSVLLDEFDSPIYLNSFCFGVRPKNQNELNSVYASFYFKSDSFRKKILHLAQGSTRYNISKKEFMEIEFLLPCVEEQVKIANYLSVLDQNIEILANQIEHAKTWRKGLLQQMFV